MTSIFVKRIKITDVLYEGCMRRKKAATCKPALGESSPADNPIVDIQIPELWGTNSCFYAAPSEAFVTEVLAN